MNCVPPCLDPETRELNRHRREYIYTSCRTRSAIVIQQKARFMGMKGGFEKESGGTWTICERCLSVDENQ